MLISLRTSCSLSAEPIANFSPLSSTFLLHYMLSDTGGTSSNPFSSTQHSVKLFSKRALERRGLSYSFRLLRRGQPSACILWVPPQPCAQSSWPSVTLQPRLAVTFPHSLRWTPGLQRLPAPPRAPSPGQTLTWTVHSPPATQRLPLRSGGLLPACQVTADGLWPGQTSQLLGYPGS